MTFYLAQMSVTEPLVYHIRVAGTLDPDFSDYVSGMAITADTAADGSAVTDLHGTLPDHSALVGVLRSLTNLGLPIMNVKCLGVPSETPRGEETSDAERPATGNGDGSADAGSATAAERVAAEAALSAPKGGRGRLGAGVGAFIGGVLGLAGGPETGVAGAVIGSGVGLYLGKKSRTGGLWSAGLERLRRPLARRGTVASPEPAAAPGEA